MIAVPAGTALCTMPHKGSRHLATQGLVCDQCAANLRELLADVQELLQAFAEGDVINPELAEHRGKNPHAPVPIDLDRWLITHPGGEPVGILPIRNAHPVTGKIESNGPDAPRIWSIIERWTAAVAERLAVGMPFGDTMTWLDFLRRHLVTVTELDDVIEFDEEFRACRRALAAAIGVPAGPAPLCHCPHCGTPLWTEHGHQVRTLLAKREDPAGAGGRLDLVHCPTCPETWDGWPRLRFLNRLVEQDRKERRERADQQRLAQ